MIASSHIIQSRPTENIRPCRNTIPVALVLLFFIVYSIIVQAAPRLGSPVSMELLDGNRLVLKKMNCSIESPWADSKWFQLDTKHSAMRSFYCQNTKTGKFFLFSVNSTATAQYNDNDMKRYFQGIEDSLKESAYKPKEHSFKASSVPIPGSFSYRYSAVGPSGEEIFFHGYLITSHYLYLIQSASTNPAVDRDLVSFAKSFVLLKPQIDSQTVPSIVMETSSFVGSCVMILYFIALFIVPKIGRKRKSAQKRPFGMGVVAFCIVILLFLLHVSFQSLLISGCTAISAREFGQLLGSVFWAFGIPFFIYSIAQTRRRNRSGDSKVV